MAECIECWRARRGLVPENGWVSSEEWKPVLNKLILILGSKAEIARRMKQNTQFFSRPRDKMRAPQFRQMEQLLVVEEKKLGIKFYNRGEAEIIDPEPFASILWKFFKDWIAERPLHTQGAQHDYFLHSDIDDENNEEEPIIDFMGPWQLLSDKTGIDIRRIQAFARKEIPQVPWSQADALLQAMNLTHYIFDGTIQVKPNPRWSMETYLDYMRVRGCI